MIAKFASLRHAARAALAVLAMVAVAAPAAAQQIQTIDPNTAIDGDLQEQPGDAPVYGTPTGETAQQEQQAEQQGSSVSDWTAQDTQQATTADNAASDNAAVAPDWTDPSRAASEASANPAQAAEQGGTYKKDDLIGAAEGVFGKGAEGLAKLIEGILKKQGEPNAYIVGREAGGALVIGARYGSGTLYHKIEGEMPVYWTGPSIGFDAGANAGNTFILVYNLYDTADLYKRFPAAEGQLYVVGGFNASYLRKGDIVLIPIRVGAGLRLGVNAGYMKFSKKQRWLPF